MIGRGLERTAPLWPAVERAFAWVHTAARVLANRDGEAAWRGRRRFDGLVWAMQRPRGRVGALGAAVDYFRKVTGSYRPGLFHADAVPGLPRTNNALEQLFGSQRYHERRATGRKTASPGAVLRGSVRLIAATATRLRAPSGRELGGVSREPWRALRRPPGEGSARPHAAHALPTRSGRLPRRSRPAGLPAGFAVLDFLRVMAWRAKNRDRLLGLTFPLGSCKASRRSRRTI